LILLNLGKKILHGSHQLAPKNNPTDLEFLIEDPSVTPSKD
jgi:hypothetical protein